jgi:two-component system cell cycle response regulator DivK
VSAESGDRPLILLVEDNDTIRHAFCILLEETGYRIAQAATGRDALLAARERRPDLILMDLGLPDTSGLEVTRQLKADRGTSAIPVVALTGRALEADEQACLDAGCSGYLSKPIDTAQLLRRIPEFIGKRE